MPGYSQAPRGLSVQSRVPRIFTRPSISPGPLPRQRPSRYTFRAGRNLPDKEFRYLRTVIVTAAVHWGFGSALARLPLTVQHRAGVSPYTSACAFAETCVFGKQSLGLFLCGPLGLSTLPGPPFSRSYGGILPSSLARVLPRALSFSLRLPVSGSVRAQRDSLAAFPGSADSATSVLVFPRTHRSRLPRRTSLPDRPRLGRARPTARCAYPPASPLRSNATLWCRNLHRLSIAYAPRPRLRSRLTLGGRSFPRNPPASGGVDSHHASRYSCRHSHFRPLHRSSRCGFPGGRNAPLPRRRRLPATTPSAAAVATLAPPIVGARALDQ
jgi:hypothetical protein